MLMEIKKQLPNDTLYYVPWKHNKVDNSELEFGLLSPDHPKMKIEHPLPVEKRLLIEPLGREFQSTKFLTSSTTGRYCLEKLIDKEKKLICLFPRYREHYSSRNWAREKYLALIKKLRLDFPDLQIAIIGEPGGTYFVDGVPTGTIDLINVEEENRTAIQIAALEKSIFAVGSSSGGLNLAYYSGCPVFKWSNPKDIPPDIDSQVLTTPVKIIPSTHPEVDQIYPEFLQLKIHLY